MRKMIPSEFNIERFTIRVYPEQIQEASGVYYVATGYPVPSKDTIQLINLKMDRINGSTTDIANILKVGYTLEAWPTQEGEQSIWFGANPNITTWADFEIIYINNPTL